MKIKKNKKSVTGVQPLMAVGTFVVDYHKVVDHFPDERSAASIHNEEVSTGGAPLNTLTNLAKLDVDFPLYAAARVGRDLDGRYILKCCEEHNINISQITAVEGATTGYTDVFTVSSTGEHTCFHYSSIGDTFSRKDVKLLAVDPKVLFLGSLGALGKMDEDDKEYGRHGATQLIKDARKRGITTVVQLSPIARNSTIKDYAETLREADYLIISHRLIEEMVGIELYTDGHYDAELARESAQMLVDHGLRKGCVIHAGVTAVCLTTGGEFIDVTGELLPSGLRAGSAGVVDAFGAGFLEGLYHDKPIDVCLRQGLVVANACRKHLTPSGGILPLKQLMGGGD